MNAYINCSAARVKEATVDDTEVREADVTWDSENVTQYFEHVLRQLSRVKERCRCRKNWKVVDRRCCG